MDNKWRRLLIAEKIANPQKWLRNGSHRTSTTVNGRAISPHRCQSSENQIIGKLKEKYGLQ
jgi:hypothetical protein